MAKQRMEVGTRPPQLNIRLSLHVVSISPNKHRSSACLPPLNRSSFSPDTRLMLDLLISTTLQLLVPANPISFHLCISSTPSCPSLFFRPSLFVGLML